MLGCGMVSSLMDVPEWELYIGYEGYLAIGELLKDEYVTFIRPIVQYFENLIIGEDSMFCHSTVRSLFNRLATPPPGLIGVDIGYYDCMNPLSRRDTKDMMAVMLPITAPEGRKCIDLMTLDYSSGNVFGHHKESLMLDGVDVPEGGKDQSSPPLMILIISLCGFLSSITLLVVLRYARARLVAQRKQGAQIQLMPQHILSECNRSGTLLGKGGEAEVYLSEISTGGAIRQVASKMYFRPDVAKAEMIFYEGLPYHENILRVYGMHIDKDSQRWCLVMEYCRHGSMR